MAAPFTHDELMTAWHNRRRPNWPASFDQVMADALLAKLVGLEAKLRRSRLQRAAQAPTPASTAPERRPCLPHTPPIFDRKRAAAGERDDD
ncbi:hypothetical protein [Aquabacterium sp.]|uniref:hypothetical protein n=1 Tax=Aquabacterium sp. TaxID=1872578 RepID=UPI002607F61C|nr:hypothetical protein [Aquabacterium sp.]MDD2975541.1 hypothetical protein [Aquabacterium sp.]